MSMKGELTQMEASHSYYLGTEQLHETFDLNCSIPGVDPPIVKAVHPG